MPAPYSMDLRLRVMDAIRTGMRFEDVIKRFRVSNSTLLRWTRRLRETGSYAALPMGGTKPFVLSDQRTWIKERLAVKPDLTLRALLGELRARGFEGSQFALWNMLTRSGISFKKRRSMQASKIGRTLPDGVCSGADRNTA